MAPMSAPATLAPLAPPPPPPKSTARSPARRAPANAASAAALLALTPAAPAAALSKDDVAGSLTKVVDTVDQAIGVGGKVAEQVTGVVKALGEAAKPALPVLKSATDEAVKLAAPVVSGASRQATEALQGAGVDPAPVLSAAKTAAEQGSKVIDAAKPVASATVETITSLAPEDLVVAAGAAFLAYLLVPPVWSLVSYTLRGYKALRPHRRADRQGQGQSRRAAAAIERQEQAHLCAAGRASEQAEGHGAQREESRGGDHGSQDLLPQEDRQGLQRHYHGLVQRHLQDCGEDAERRRVQELLGHGRRLLRPERVGAEPTRDGLFQPLRGRGRDAVEGDPCGCWPDWDDRWPQWDDLVGVQSDLSQASSRQHRLMRWRS
ncbi:unnamed protein product [Urochloa decumbens]|uniref:Uncharacterized protein n=1 Tax=Urochloa decumbens TaxID=240449 RepID=A0ABC9EDV7_9POAL